MRDKRETGGRRKGSFRVNCRCAVPVSGTFESERALTPPFTTHSGTPLRWCEDVKQASGNEKVKIKFCQPPNSLRGPIPIPPEDRRRNMKIEQHFIPSAAATREKELQDYEGWVQGGGGKWRNNLICPILSLSLCSSLPSPSSLRGLIAPQINVED